MNGVPTGTRTPVPAVKGRCPSPLDDGDFNIHSFDNLEINYQTLR